MDVIHGQEALPLDAADTSVTIGFFDGVHRGHQDVIGRTVEVAGERSLTPVAVTFDRHPRSTYAPGTEPKLLTTLERKAGHIEELGIEALVVLEFTEEFAAWPADAFVERVLLQGLRARHAVVGSNFTYGFRAMGTVATLEAAGREHGFGVEARPLLAVGGRGVSSSSIRAALEAGELDWPAEALGRPFVLDGTVTSGAGRGAGLGWPTANLDVPAGMLLPGRGIYAGRAHLDDGAVHPAAISVGTNPTFGDEPMHAEAFLLDFDGDLRGAPIGVEFLARLRDERRFDTPEALSEQISRDVEHTRAVVAAAVAGT